MEEIAAAFSVYLFDEICKQNDRWRKKTKSIYFESKRENR